LHHADAVAFVFFQGQRIICKDNKGLGGRVVKKELLELLLRMCKVCDVSQKDIQGHSERKILVGARKAFVSLAKLYGASLDEIGRVLGNRDHSVIVSYLRKIKDVKVRKVEKKTNAKGGDKK